VGARDAAQAEQNAKAAQLNVSPADIDLITKRLQALELAAV
jgi:aryl-alcohol dehydrogenase-like predicted oxidoreductase